jgi:zinc protease
MPNFRRHPMSSEVLVFWQGQSMIRILFFLVLSLALGFGPALSAETKLPPGVSEVTAVEGVAEFRLANGLRLLLIPDASVDTVTVNVTYLVGSRHEGYGEAGMAHLLEHMLFRGTPTRPSIWAELKKIGASANGTTSFDRTNYFETFPASESNLDVALGLEADRMLNSFVSRKDLDAEMTVVRNEFESGENSPFGVLRQRVAATAYLWHAYGRSIIGSRSDIENVPVERLQAFYRNYYQPDNAVLIIAGRFDEGKALALAARHFGNLPKPGRELRPTYTVEPTQDGERTVTLRRSGDVQIVSAMYHMPPGTHADYAAIDLLVALIGHVPSGRLHKALVEAGLASSAFGSEQQQQEAGYAYFGAIVRQGQSLEAARDAMLAVLEGFARNPVTEDEVQRARTRLLNDIELGLASSRSLAGLLSETAAMGDWRMLFLHRDRLRQVNAADVQRVATAYLKSSNRTLGMFLPTGAPDRAEIPPVPDVAAVLKDYRGAGPVAQGETFDPTPENIEARVIRRTLAGGMKLALLPKKTRGGTVVAQLGLRWGNESAKLGRSTACGIASAMLMRGTKKSTREQLTNEFARLKANVGAGGEGGSVETVRENLPQTLRLVAEVLREPSFPEGEFEQLRLSSLTSLEIQKHDPGALAGIELVRHLNPHAPEHWNYSPTLEERAARLKALTLDEVRRCYAEFVGASDSELTVVGDFDPEEIVRLTDELFGDWKSPRPYARIPQRYFDARGIDRTIETPDKANATLRAGENLKLRDDHADFPALVLGNYLLGGGPDSRLWRRVREREGLSYGVGSFLSASSFEERGDFGLYAIYAPQNRARVETALREELGRALSDGFTAEEVDAGKKDLLNARKLARTQDGALAGRLLSYLVLGRTFAWDTQLEKRIQSLTPEEVLEALRRHLDPGKLSFVKAGDFSARRPNAAARN